MTKGASYTTQLGAGLGMIQETMALLRIWEPGIGPSQLSDTAIKSGVFARATARRARNIALEMFAPRYMENGGVVAGRLRFLLENRFPQESLVQLFFLQTARAQSIFADFVIEIYWPKYSTGATSLARNDAESFVRRALDSGKMAKQWADSMVLRVSGYLVGCCLDFGLVGEGSRNHRTINRFSIRRDVAVYLAYDLHSSGLSDMQLVGHRDWALFGLEPQEVVELLKSLSHDGHLLVQSSGELVQISWRYKSMHDCLHALTQG